MTVKELIELLNRFAPDLLVRIDDVHQGGSMVLNGEYWFSSTQNAIYLEAV